MVTSCHFRRNAMEFFKRYAFSLSMLVIALIVIFWVLSLIGKHAPGVIGTTADKVGSLASGQAYSFS